MLSVSDCSFPWNNRYQFAKALSVDLAYADIQLEVWLRHLSLGSLRQIEPCKALHGEALLARGIKPSVWVSLNGPAQVRALSVQVW